MRTSDSIKELAAALAKAQGMMHGAKKDTSNPFFKSKYADLASHWEAARPALAANGLCIIQGTRPSDKDEVIVITRLAHESGEWTESELAVPVSKADAQGYGSALTYGRRYGFSATIGTAGEDDDGNAAAAAKPQRPNTATQVAVDAFEALPEDEQKFLMDHVTVILDKAASKDDDLYHYIESQHFDTEEKLALWSRLPSNVRSAIKKQQPATLGSQA